MPMDLDHAAGQIQDHFGDAPVAVVVGGTPPGEEGPNSTVVAWTGNMHRELYELLETAKLNRAITHLTDEQEGINKKITFEVNIEVDE